MKTLIALIKREVLEHQRALLRVPLILIGLAVLIRLSMMFGDLSIPIDVPEQLQLDDKIESGLDYVTSKGLGQLNYAVMIVMSIVAIAYSLSSLFDERQDQSVLFWRSLPVSDSMTVASKFATAVILVPILILLVQTINTFLFLGIGAFSYLVDFFPSALQSLLKLGLWTMLPVVSWCLLCSGVSKKHPLLMAIMVPVLVKTIDWLFLDGALDDNIAINGMTSLTNFSASALIWSSLFAAGCLAFTVTKRRQRF